MLPSALRATCAGHALAVVRDRDYRSLALDDPLRWVGVRTGVCNLHVACSPTSQSRRLGMHDMRDRTAPTRSSVGDDAHATPGKHTRVAALAADPAAAPSASATSAVQRKSSDDAELPHGAPDLHLLRSPPR